MGFTTPTGLCQTPRRNSFRNGFESRSHKPRDHKVPRRKAFSVSSLPRIGDIDFEKQLSSVVGLSNESDCNWLSSDSKSSSFFSSDDSLDALELDSLDLHLQENLLSMLSSSKLCHMNQSAPVLDVSTKESAEELSVAADGMKKDSHMDELKDSIPYCVESYDSSNERSLSGYSSSCGSSQIQDNEDILIASFDLIGEDSKFDERRRLYFPNSDFSTPPFSAKRSLQMCSPHSGYISSCQGLTSSSESVDSESNEPIFWPFEQSSYWRPELNDFFCISPRKAVTDCEAAEADGTKLRQLKINQPKRSQPRKTISDGCRRKLVFKSPPPLPTTENKTLTTSRSIPKISPATSRRHISSPVSPLEKKPSKTIIGRKTRQLKEDKRKHSDDQHLSKPLLDFESKEIQNFVAAKNSIEKRVGLDEFNGHEGVGVGSDEELCFLSASNLIEAIEMDRPIDSSLSSCMHHG